MNFGQFSLKFTKIIVNGTKKAIQIESPLGKLVKFYAGF